MVSWLFTAALSEDRDVSTHAILRLWKHVHQVTTSSDATLHRDLACEVEQLDTRTWRRLGLLLFADDVTTVRAIVRVVVDLVEFPRGDHGIDWHAPLRRRVWTSDWRQFILDKLADCQTQAPDIAAQLIVILRSVFISAVHQSIATPKQQAQLIDAFVDTALTGSGVPACLALETLHQLLDCEAKRMVHLDEDVRAYLYGSRVFAVLFTSLTESSSTERHPASGQATRSRRCVDMKHHQRLSLKVLVAGCKSSVDVVRVCASNPQTLVDLVLSVVEAPTTSTGDDLRALALLLLATVLDDTPSTEAVAGGTASTLRLSGALITVTWLLIHDCCNVREVAHAVLRRTIALSCPSDIVRVLVEQGCVVIVYLSLAVDNTSPAHGLLQCVKHQLEETDGRITESLLETCAQSTNAKLQRNVLLSLLMLNTSTEGGGVDHATLRAHAEEALQSPWSDGCLAAAIISTLLLCCDKTSALRLAASVRRKSVASMAQEPGDASVINLRCTNSDTVAIDEHTLYRHCLRVPPPSTTLVFEKDTVELFVALLEMDQPSAIQNLKQRPHGAIADLLRLAKLFECTKVWHLATLVLSQDDDWKAALDAAIAMRHPTLMQRTLRSALAVAAPSELVHAASRAVQEVCSQQG